jgi:hypothetical protein
MLWIKTAICSHTSATVAGWHTVRNPVRADAPACNARLARLTVSASHSLLRSSNRWTGSLVHRRRRNRTAWLGERTRTCKCRFKKILLARRKFSLCGRLCWPSRGGAWLSQGFGYDVHGVRSAQVASLRLFAGRRSAPIGSAVASRPDLVVFFFRLRSRGGYPFVEESQGWQEAVSPLFWKDANEHAEPSLRSPRD